MTANYTFYSYKGGSGRTTTLLNTTKHLIDEMGACPEKPILLIDSDLESAGLTYFFNLQDKFTDLFQKSIHACKIINSGEFLMRNENVFGICDSDTRNLSLLIKSLEAHFEKIDLNAVLGDVEISATEFRILQKIADQWSTYNELRAAVKGQDLAIAEKYNTQFSTLIKTLDAITISKLTAEEKVAKKVEVIKAFLPATSFVDVSHFFEKPFGTVKFLGVDVEYQGKQLVENSSIEAMMQLTEECSKRNYCAILYDSGAGGQTSANALHKISDVIVCCMRPSQQFIHGTRMQLVNNKKSLKERNSFKEGENKKIVIMLPTAVPAESAETIELQNASFNDIAKLANDYSQLVDNYFCAPEKSVHEVSLFKWREQILGVKDAHELSDSVRAISDLYARYETMPEDAKNAYGVYLEVAKKLIENT